MRRNIKAFTLVELLVVIGIIAVLISILMPALTRARIAATALQCQGNMKQLAQAVILYATENKGYYPSNDAYQPNPNNPTAYLLFNWWTPPLIGKYLNNRSVIPYYVSTRVYFCPALQQTTTSAPHGQWGNDFGIGYNASSSIRNNYLYIRYPAMAPTNPGYPAAEAGMVKYNLKVARMGRVKRAAEVLVFTDVGGGTASEGGNRFVQLYNAAAGTLNPPNTGSYGLYLTNPSNEAVSYRHGLRANVAFLDGHVEPFAAKTPDNWTAGTHKDEGIHLAWKNGQIRVNALDP